MKFLLRDLAALTSRIYCNSQHEASVNRVCVSYDESYWPERISHNFLVCWNRKIITLAKLYPSNFDVPLSCNINRNCRKLRSIFLQKHNFPGAIVIDAEASKFVEGYSLDEDTIFLAHRQGEYVDSIA